MQFNQFPIISYGSFLLPWQPNQEADHHNFSYYKLSLPKLHLYEIRVIKFRVAMTTKQNDHWSKNTYTG